MTLTFTESQAAFIRRHSALEREPANWPKAMMRIIGRFCRAAIPRVFSLALFATVAGFGCWKIEGANAVAGAEPLGKALNVIPDPRHFSRSVNVRTDFGAKGDGKTDDWEAFQRAEGMNAMGICAYSQPTLVVVPPTRVNDYVISQAIRLCSNVTMWVKSNGTRITFINSMRGTDIDYTGATHVNVWPFTGAILGGNVVADSTLPTYPLSGTLAVGASSVTLTRPLDAGLLRPGDLVDVETTSIFAPAGVEPTNLKMALVIAANIATGKVEFDRPMDFASSSVQLRKLTNLARTPGWPAINDNSNVPVFAVHHCGIYGGKWIAGSAQAWAQAFNDGGGMLDCKIAPDEVVAADGVGWGNLMQDSAFSVRREVVSHAALELAYHSSNTVLDIGTVEMVAPDPGVMPARWVVAINEGSHANKITIHHIEIRGAGATAALLVVGNVSKAGHDLLHASVIVPTINGGSPIKVTYSTRAGDRLSQVAEGIATALKADQALIGAGLSVSANPAGHRGGVLVRDATSTIPFCLEGSKSNELVVYQLSLDILRITNGYDNRIRIQSVHGGPIDGSVVDIADVATTGVTPPTSGNDVALSKSKLAMQKDYVNVRGPRSNDNMVHDGVFHGPTFQSKAFWFQADSGEGNELRNLYGDAPGAACILQARDDHRNILANVALSACHEP